MLDIDLLLVISLTDIFSHSVPCLFILWMVSFAGQKLVRSSHRRAEETSPRRVSGT